MSRFVRFIVENEHFTILLTLIILLYGALSILRINLVQDPEVDFPLVHVDLSLPEATPSEIETNVVFPIENELRTVLGLEDVISTIEHGKARIRLEYQLGIDAPQKSREVESRINNIRGKLPQRLDYRVRAFTASDAISAFVIAVQTPDADPATQLDLAFDFANVLGEVDHLKNIRLIQSEQDIVVALDVPALRRLGVSLEHVARQIRAANAYSPNRQMLLEDTLVRFGGPARRLETIGDFADIAIHTAGGAVIRLADIGYVAKAARGSAILSRFNRADATFIEVGVDPTEVNILATRDAIAQAARIFEASSAQPVTLRFVFDQSEGVRSLVFGLLQNFVQGFVILLIVLVLAVGYRSAFIITSILPLSFLAAITIFSFTGYGVQQVALAGFIIALGLMVDNGIVVTENAYLLQRYEGHTRRAAALAGTSRAIGPLFASTLTTVLAFAPLFILTSDAAIYLRSLSVTIWLSLLMSLFFAATLATVLLARIGTIGPILGLPTPPSFLNGLIPFRDHAFRQFLRLAVRWRAVTLLLFLAFFAASLHAFRQLELQVFPITGDPYFTVNVNVPANMSDGERMQLVTGMEDALGQIDGIVSTAVVVGRPFPYVNVSMTELGDIVFLVHTDVGDEARIIRLMADAASALKPLEAYAEINMFPFQRRDGSFPSPFAVVLSGSDSKRLRDYARRIDARVRLTEGVGAVRNPMKSGQLAVRLQYLPEQASALGLARSDVETVMRTLTSGREIDRFRDRRGREFPVLLRFSLDEERPLSTIDDITIPLTKDGGTPLRAVVAPTLEESEGHIRHHQFTPTVEIDVWLEEGYGAAEVAENVVRSLGASKPPPGIAMRIGGALQQGAEDFRELGFNVAMLAALIFSIFVLQFRSFAQPVIIFSALPLCLIGAVIGLNMADLPLTFFAAIGLTSLMGIVVNDSILLVDEGNRIRAASPHQAASEVAVEAGIKRFMPVLLTSVTTIAGLTPMALSDTVFKTVAVTIIGGLASSTLLVLILVPVLFSYLTPAKAGR